MGRRNNNDNFEKENFFKKNHITSNKDLIYIQHLKGVSMCNFSHTNT